MRTLILSIITVLFATGCTDQERIDQYEKQLKESNEALEKIIDFRMSSFTAAAYENPEKAGLYCSKKFSNFFSSYAQAFNKQQNRTGSLFQKQFKRKNINSEKYLYQLIHYIHNNPIAANLVNDLDEWKFSSYQALVSKSPTFLQRNKVLDLYDDLENFKLVHSRSMTYDKVQ